jgi:HK97 gp10 family phage protein
MYKLNISIPNLKSLEKKFDVLNSDIVSSLKASIQTSEKLAKETLVKNTPVDTGNLQSSVTSRIEDSGLRADIYPDNDKAYYGKFVEFGHHTRSGSWVPGQFFVARTVAIIKPTIDRIFKINLRNILKKF